MPDILSPREAAIETAVQRITDLAETVRGGEQDGITIVPLNAAVDALRQPLDPPDSHGADVRSPARVVVSAVCPSCGQTADIALAISTELRMDDDGSSLHLRGKSKAKTHTCGQQPLGLLDAIEDFSIGDITG